MCSRALARKPRAQVPMISVSVQLNFGGVIAKPKKGQRDEDGRAGRA